MVRYEPHGAVPHSFYQTGTVCVAAKSEVSSFIPNSRTGSRLRLLLGIPKTDQGYVANMEPATECPNHARMTCVPLVRRMRWRISNTLIVERTR